MKKIQTLCLFLLVAIGCQQHPARKAAVDDSFVVFLHQFNQDTVFQLKRVVFPLPTKATESENFTEVAQLISKQEYTPIYFTEDLAQQKREGYTQHIVVAKNKATIEIRGIENGIMADYFFEKRAGKWMLVACIDSST